MSINTVTKTEIETEIEAKSTLSPAKSRLRKREWDPSR